MAERAVAGKWRTCDIKTVAFLLYSGFAVTAARQEHGRVSFEFEDGEERRDAVLSFWNKQQSVEPVAFMECQNRARDMVTQAKGD